LLAAGGVFASVSDAERIHEGLANALVILVLSIALGYTLTTFSVLSYSSKGHVIKRDAPADNGQTTVILLAPGEPTEYEVTSAARRLALADDAQDVPPVLLRPFYLRDLRSKYTDVGRSPYREYHMELARKVQSRLDATHRVHMAFYSDEPTLAGVLADALGEGTARIILVHVRISDPPDPVMSGDLFEGLKADRYGAELAEVGPLWNSDLLPQVYVRRVLEAVPQVDAHPENVGLLLVGRGHPAPPGSGKGQSSAARREQEQVFQDKVRGALLKVGFDSSRVELGWLRRQEPGAAAALEKLAAAGCKTVLWMPSTFPADGITTLYDVPAALDSAARSHGIKLASLGAWNADDLAAEEIAARVRTVSIPADPPLAARAL
jgi:protoheme ferro-lyase